MIILYLVLVSALGFTALEILNRFFKLKTKGVTCIEYGILSACFGFLLFTLYMMILAFLNIKYNFWVLFTIPIINVFIALILLIKRIVNCYHGFKWEFKFDFETLLNIVFDIVLVILFVYLFVEAYSNYIFFPDEFNYWAVQARSIFIDKVTNSFAPSYPSFSPYLTSGYYFFINSISNNQVRIFQTIFLLFCYLLTIDLGRKHSINKLIIKAFYILIIIGYPAIMNFSTSLYADISFMFFYSFSIFYLYEWIFKERNNFYFIGSIIFLALTIWTKTDGLFLSLYSYFIIILCSIFYKKLSIKKISFKRIITYFITTISSIVLWKIYLKFYVPSSNTDVLPNGLSLFNFPSMLIAMRDQVFSSMLLTCLLVIFLIIVFLIIPKYYKKEMYELYFLISFVFINFMFLVVCYLTIFSGEGKMAASFTRYMCHVLPVLVFVISYIFNDFLEGKK